MTQTKTQLSHGEVFEHKGKLFRFEIVRDDDMGEPWKEHDGHGIVSEWVRRDKKPGELVLCSDRGSKRFYDMEETVKIAFRDGWGCETGELQTRLKRQPTRKEIAAESARKDFENMQAWCEDRWYWVGVVVTMLKADDDAEGGVFETRHKASLWGIESSSGHDHLTEVGFELAEELAGE